MDIMLDLETLSSAPDAAIVSIGAVTFSTSGRPLAPADGDTFYCDVDAVSSERMGGRISASTVQWWMQQSEGARATFARDGVDLAVALGQFITFCGRWERPRIWGNGANFDNVVLRAAFERAHRIAPWEYRDDRCYRTLKNLRRDIAMENPGIAHHALHDAIAQAAHAEKIFAALALPGPQQ